MKSFKFFMILIPVFFMACEQDEQEEDQFLSKLKSVEGIDARKFSPPENFTSAYELDITQPLDHNNPDIDTFTQKAYLYHRDESAPVVFAPSGSMANDEDGYEITEYLQANQLMVTHRFISGSEPPQLNWDYLTLEQSAADHHRIVEKMQQVYDAPWVSTGRRKGGYTALIHKRFYPDDVSATIAYVTPFYNSIWDLRPQQYFEELSTEECYNKLEQVQIALLKRKPQIITRFQSYLRSSNYRWSLDYELIYELAVMDYPSSFWQYHGSYCDYIPDTTASDVELHDHFVNIVNIEGFSHEYISFYYPVVYQYLFEIGTIGYRTEHLAEYLNKVPVGSEEQNPNFELIAPDVSINYDSTAKQDIYDWLTTQGNNIIYIYGENDPFTATAIELTGETNAIKLVQEGVNRNVNIDSLDQRGTVLSKIEEWTGIPVN